ncbi:hypothetical protein RHGRI_026350 [Rhododendron griersonianum]|uniref:Uncharacterized protein n=1 Tax=Rhododendron griersonianum TaxID=479676 RepID=A0AAV6ISL4_9ERIC|nr:hypothetical protein RHGRI_026350 [Rhododendron griersonianum]
MSAAAEEERGKRGWFDATAAAAVGRRRNLSYPARAGGHMELFDLGYGPLPYHFDPKGGDYRDGRCVAIRRRW